MGSAAGGGGQPKAETNPYAQMQSDRTAEIWPHLMPFMQSVLGQANQLSRTGKIKQTNSLLGTMTEAAKTGVAKGKAQTSDLLGRFRLAGTPFGARIAADQAMAGEQQIANVAPSFYQWFLPQAMNFATGNMASAQQGMSSVSGAEANRVSSQVGAQGNYATQQAANYGSMMTKMIPSTSFSFTG